jgi:uncharacterized membrane protein (UPF0182 family)
MRAASDMPRRTSRASGRGRVVLVVALVLLFVLITSLRGIASFYTDYLWFDSLGQSGVWTGVLGAKLLLSLIFTGGFFVLLFANLVIADRIAPAFRPAGPEEELLERYHELVGPRTNLVRITLCVLLALIAGAGVSAEWNSWILFQHGGSFGVKDPQFHRDIGFYVFKLPFLSFLTGWTFAALLIVLIVTAVAHYLNGGIRVQTTRQRVTPHVKAHLSVLLALVALVKAFDYLLVQRYELTASTTGIVDGAGYTEVKAQLPAIYLLLLISLAAAAMFIINIWLRGWVLPTLGVGLWVLIAVIAAGIYPQFVQRVQVDPNEDTKERPYIARNIEATRAALGLDVEVRKLDPLDNKSRVDLSDNLDTVRNIRLWDPRAEISGKTFQQLQGIRNYYKLDDVDVDRYTIDGKPTQVTISVRDLNPDGIPRKSWVARHINYTHGHGVVVAPSTASTSSDEPDFIVSDVPIKSTVESLKLTNPSVYFGEGLGDYAVVSPGVKREVDYQDGDQTLTTAYDGKDGVATSSLVRRAAFALRFGDVNPLISKSVDDRSKVLMLRDVRKRAESLAPFLHFDNDPYPVIHDGRVVWILDAYTTTDRYPYAQRAETDGLVNGSGLDHRFNYVRNSVKAVVDAYDGTVDLYVMPGDDPIVGAYRDAFPKLFKGFADMPADLKEHLRYPEDLFRVQTAAWARYHLTDPARFYNTDDSWLIAKDPGASSAVTTTTAAAGNNDSQPKVGNGGQDRVAPYYQLLQLPGEKGVEFVLLRPFVPFSDKDDRQQLTAFMVARTDGDNYGKLVTYEMPSGNLPDGPGIVSASIQSSEEVSQLETLLGSPETGSNVIYGNLLLIPVDDVLLYVQPFYVEAKGKERQIPQLRKVIAVFGDEVAIEDTLGEALTKLFGTALTTPDQTSPDDPTGPEPSTPTGTPAERAAKLLVEAQQLYDDAQKALENGDLGGYQKKIVAYQAKVAEASRLLSGANGSGSDTSTSSSSSTTSTTAGVPG